jgi:hypothetical protein
LQAYTETNGIDKKKGLPIDCKTKVSFWVIQKNDSVLGNELAHFFQ